MLLHVLFSELLVIQANNKNNKKINRYAVIKYTIAIINETKITTKNNKKFIKIKIIINRYIQIIIIYLLTNNNIV